MRVCLLCVAVGWSLLLPACSFRSNRSEANSPPADPTPIRDSSADDAADEVVELVAPEVVNAPVEPEYNQDPAPAPPTEFNPVAPAESPPELSSAEDILKSVGRVLQGAVEGRADGEEQSSGRSVFGSIGRALSKGFQEASAERTEIEQAAESTAAEVEP